MSTAAQGADAVGGSLPDVVRRRVLELAAAALASMPDNDVPAALVQVRRFAPGRRASAGATPLASALERDAAFRARVASALREEEADLAQALADGQVPAAAEPAEVAAAAYLLRGTGWEQQLSDAVAELRAREAGSAARAGEQELDRLRSALDDATRRAEQVQREAEQSRLALEEELAGIRRELRRHRSDADRARAQARSAVEAAQERTEQAERDVAGAQQRAAKAEAELARAQDALAALRRADREGRSLASSRARLLLDTVVDAATGLRRELGLAPADVMPADLVGEAAQGPSAGDLPARARTDDDPSVLAELLAMPRVHLLVDGYNVTKGAYGELPLADQRARLVRGLAGLHARTRAEVTCCFDGAVVEGRVAPPAARGVRVRFSDPGETADELIRRLARAEPRGRVVVVVSSDREVADGVRDAGARPVPSAALVRFLERT